MPDQNNRGHLRPPETFQRVLGASGEAMEVVLTADNNHTLLGTLVLENAHVVPDQPLPTTPPPLEYDDRGATMYAVAVIVVYGFSIVMLIASHTYMKRKRKRDGDDMSSVNKYLEQVPKLKERSQRDSFRRLKMSIIPMASIVIGRDITTLKSDPGTPIIRPGTNPDPKSVRFQFRIDPPSPAIHEHETRKDNRRKSTKTADRTMRSCLSEAVQTPVIHATHDLSKGPRQHARLLSTSSGVSMLSGDTEMTPCSAGTTSLPSLGDSYSSGVVCGDLQTSSASEKMWLESEIPAQGTVTPHSGKRAQRDQYMQQAREPPIGHLPKSLTGAQPAQSSVKWPIAAGEAQAGVARPVGRHHSSLQRAPGVTAVGVRRSQEEQQKEGDECAPLQVTTV